MTGKGVWSFDAETGEFILSEEIAAELFAIKKAAAFAFNEKLYDELAKRTSYTVDELREAWQVRATDRSMREIERADKFIIEALTGEL